MNIFPSPARFGSFETAKSYVADERGTLAPSHRVACGLVAGVCEAIFAVTPMETVKVKFINDRRSENPRYKGFFHGVTTIVKDQGMLHLFYVYINKVVGNVISVDVKSNFRSSRCLSRGNGNYHEARK